MFYSIHVEFNKDSIEILEDQIIIGIRANPVKGEANKEIIKKLSKHFGVPSSSITIKSGQKSKNKIIEIRK